MTSKYRTPGNKYIISSSSTTKSVASSASVPSKRARQDLTKMFNHCDNYIETMDLPAETSNESEGDAMNHDGFELSLLAHFDEIIRGYEDAENTKYILLNEYLRFAENQELCRVEWQKITQDNKRLQSELEKAHRELDNYASRLRYAKNFIDCERKLRKRAEDERLKVEEQMHKARDLLFSDRTCLPDDTREKLAFLNKGNMSRNSLDYNNYSNAPATANRLNTISEVNSSVMNSTGSLLSNLSYSRSEDGLDLSFGVNQKWKRVQQRSDQQQQKQQHTEPNPSPMPRKRKSSGANGGDHHIVEINPTDKIVATTTVSLTKDGPITATSIIETIPQDEKNNNNNNNNNNNGIGVIPDIPMVNILSNQPTPRKSNNSNNKNKKTDWVDVPFTPVVTSTFTSPSQSTPTIPTAMTTSTATTTVPSSVKKQHSLTSRVAIKPEQCSACGKRIRFGKYAFKCKECKSICHGDCKEALPLPCVPIMNTPNPKGTIGNISDYVSTVAPLVPPLIVHCINEIEMRGLQEVGLYRVSGSERDVKMLKEKLLRSKLVPNLNDIDVHVVCGVLKDFLRNLKEPLVTGALRGNFIEAVESEMTGGSNKHSQNAITSHFYEIIAQLPQPNRDTMAYIMLHLHKVANSKECKMPLNNLAKVFGPTIVGYSSQDIDPQMMVSETHQQLLVMEHLLNIPCDFWTTFVNINSSIAQTPHREPVQTPRQYKFFSPSGNIGGGFSRSDLSNKRKKFFPTPPSKK